MVTLDAFIAMPVIGGQPRGNPIAAQSAASQDQGLSPLQNGVYRLVRACGKSGAVKPRRQSRLNQVGCVCTCAVLFVSLRNIRVR